MTSEYVAIFVLCVTIIIFTIAIVLQSKKILKYKIADIHREEAQARTEKLVESPVTMNCDLWKPIGVLRISEETYNLLSKVVPHLLIAPMGHDGKIDGWTIIVTPSDVEVQDASS